VKILRQKLSQALSRNSAQKATKTSKSVSNQSYQRVARFQTWICHVNFHLSNCKQRGLNSAERMQHSLHQIKTSTLQTLAIVIHIVTTISTRRVLTASKELSSRQTVSTLQAHLHREVSSPKLSPNNTVFYCSADPR